MPNADLIVYNKLNKIIIIIKIINRRKIKETKNLKTAIPR